MKKTALLLSGILAVLAVTANGATNISYNATASPAANPDGWNGSSNVDVWTTSTTGSNAGFFQGNSANNGGGSGAGAGSTAWAMYANSGDQAFADHTFAGGALNVGQTVSLDFDNGWIDTSRSTGIQLRDGTTLLFALYFNGGGSNYLYLDSGGADQSTGVSFTADGGTFTFTLTSSTTYNATWRTASWNGTLVTGSIDNIRVFNNSAGSGSNYDVFFDNLTIVPEPSSVLLAAVGIASLTLLRRRRRTP